MSKGYIERQTTEALGIAFTNFDYEGLSGNRYRISVTVRDGGRQEAEDSLLALLDIINDVIDKQFIPDYEDIPERDFDGQVVTKDKVTGNYLGLLDYAPKSSDLKSGQTYELKVNAYKLKDGEIQFWNKDHQYPAHTHKLNEYGVKVMAEVLDHPGWDKQFKQSDNIEDFPGGEGIIKIEGSKKLTSAGNPYKNLVGFRRP